MKRGKIVKKEGISMLDGKMTKNIEECADKYLGILDAGAVKHEEMKSQIKKKYIRGATNILKSKLNRGNIILAINSRAGSIASNGAGIKCWSKMELEELDWKTRKRMAIYRTYHAKADVDRIYLQRREVREGEL